MEDKTNTEQKSQKQRLEELLTEMGVDFKSGATETTIHEGDGYKNFFNLFTFDKSGKFIKQGCWE